LDSEFPRWILDVRRAIQGVRKVLRQGAALDLEELMRAVRKYLRAHEKFVRSVDLFRTHAAEQAEGRNAEELAPLLRQSERYERAHDYSVSQWLEDLANLLRVRLEDDRKVLREFPELLRDMASRAERPESEGIISPRLRHWIRTATPEKIQAMKDGFREEVRSTGAAIREIRHAAQRILDQSVRKVVRRGKSDSP